MEISALSPYELTGNDNNNDIIKNVIVKAKLIIMMIFFYSLSSQFFAVCYCQPHEAGSLPLIALMKI